MSECWRITFLAMATAISIPVCAPALGSEIDVTANATGATPFGMITVLDSGNRGPDEKGLEDGLVARALQTLPLGDMSIPVQPTKLQEPTSAQRNAAPDSCSRKTALGTSRTLVVDTSGGLEVGFKSYHQSLQLADREVVLTFDDGPLPIYTERVLNALRDECVKATFFLVGRNAQAHPDLVRREIADGHTIAHHSWSHPDKTLRGVSPAAAKSEIVEGISAVQLASGQEPYKDGKPRVPFFRFPGFADTPALKEMLAARDIGVFGADVWAADWNPMSPATQLRFVLQRLDEVGRGIILFHDTRPQTAAMMPDFLAALKARHYRVVHMVPGRGAPMRLREAPVSWTSETEVILARVMPRLLRKKAGEPPQNGNSAGGFQSIDTVRNPEALLNPPPVSKNPSRR